MRSLPEKEDQEQRELHEPEKAYTEEQGRMDAERGKKKLRIPKREKKRARAVENLKQQVRKAALCGFGF